MSYQISDEEHESVTALPGPERYQHFLNRVADWQEVWGLRGADGWVMLGDEDDRQCIPLWPHPRYALALAADGSASSGPAAIALDVLLEKWLPGMERDGLGAAVFPTCLLKGIVVEPLRLKQDLESAREDYQ